MSQLGRIVFYNHVAVPDARERMQRLFCLFAPQLVISAWARAFQPPPWNHEGRIPIDPEADEEEWISFGRPILDRKVPDVLLAIAPFKETITASLGVGPRAEQFFEGLNTEIPADIRGDFVPWEPVISVGPHDIFDGDLRGLIRVAHAQISVTMQCQRVPLNGKEYERLVFGTKSAQRLRADLEAICGPLRHWIGWDY